MRTSNLGWRRGQIIVLAPFMVSVLGGVVAITADVGHMFVEKALLQNTADGAALAATWVLTEQRGAGHSEHDARAAALAEALAIRNANRPQARPWPSPYHACRSCR